VSQLFSYRHFKLHTSISACQIAVCLAVQQIYTSFPNSSFRRKIKLANVLLSSRKHFFSSCYFICVSKLSREVTVTNIHWKSAHIFICSFCTFCEILKQQEFTVLKKTVLFVIVRITFSLLLFPSVKSHWHCRPPTFIFGVTN
jgi:hypothetical protein